MQIRTVRNSLLLLSAAVSIACCTLAAKCAMADEPLSSEKPIPPLEWAYQGAAIADMMTTLDIKNHPNLQEENVILGPHPSDGKVLAYFAATGGLHYLITRELVNGNAPKPLVSAWELISTSFEISYAAHNYSLGLRFKL